MKRFTAFILMSAILCAMLVLPSAAADEAYINAPLTAYAIETAPVTDGVVNADEYGAAPSLTYSEDKEQFAAPDDHDDYNNWDFDFYITWDADSLYMAWVVKSEIHHPLEKASYDAYGNIISGEWPEDGSMLGHMWWNSCVQFTITPSAPDADTAKFASDYLDVGICQLDDNTVGRVAWMYPNGVTADDISINDWDAAVVRDDVAKTTTYEVAIPWKMSGIAAPGSNAQFGLSFAVAAQENYYVKKGMIEWNDAILEKKIRTTRESSLFPPMNISTPE